MIEIYFQDCFDQLNLKYFHTRHLIGANLSILIVPSRVTWQSYMLSG